MVDACTGIANHANEGIRPLIYPNPSKGVINVMLRNTPKNASIRVTNMLGEVVADLPQAEIFNSIDLKENSNGLYLVAILQNGKVTSIAKIVKEAYQDPTTDDERWVAVDVAAHKKLKKPVSLAQIKEEPRLAQMALVRLGRLSVQPVTDEEWEIVMKMAGELSK